MIKPQPQVMCKSFVRWDVINSILLSTALRWVQITPKTSKNITWYLYSRGPVRQVCLLLTNQLAGFPMPIPFRFDIPSWHQCLTSTWTVLLHTGNLTAFIAPPQPGVATCYRDTYLKLEMCMLWSRGLSMSLAILHICLKQLLEEQVKTVLLFS